MNTQGLEWAFSRAESVYIAPYKDGKLMWLIGPGIPANIAVHLDDDEDDDNSIQVYFTKDVEIRRADTR